jgi:hypothetical protein
LLKDLQARGTGGIENLSGSIGLNIGRGGHLNIAKNINQDADTECFKATEDIGYLSHGRFNHRCFPVSLLRTDHMM